MPRRGNIAKRDVLPDPLYNSKLVTRLINSVMLDGKKGVAQKIVYGAFDIVKDKTGREALEAVSYTHLPGAHRSGHQGQGGPAAGPQEKCHHRQAGSCGNRNVLLP